MKHRTQATFVALWHESWFYRINVVLAAVGLVYLFTR